MSELNMNWEILANKDYAFLTENPILRDNVMLLTLGGSHAYGTNVETSDIDVRGIVYNPIDALLGNKNFEQFEDSKTDTTIFGLNKMVRMLLEANPNVLECLGSKPDHYILLNEDGRKLIENRKLFLSKRVIYTFGGYANAQLRRLQNALARDSYTQSEKESHILGSIKGAMNSIVGRYHTVNGKLLEYDFSHNESKMIHAFKEYNEKMQNMESYKNFENGSITLYPDVSNNEGMETEIYIDAVLNHYPLRDYKNIWSEMNSIVKDYDKLGKRNTKKDDMHLNKHAMHLVRLYFMCIDILEKEDIVTYREKEHDLLMDIRKGSYQKADGTYRSEFFELVDDLEKKMNYAADNTSLPDKPDIETVHELLADMNKRHILKSEVFYD